MLSSTLNANAAEFVPSFMAAAWESYDESCAAEGDDFAAVDAFFSAYGIPEDQLFDAMYHPMTPEEVLELEQVDEINSMLAELELMETHQELHHSLHEKAKELRMASDVDAEIQSLMQKTSIGGDNVKNQRFHHQHSGKKPHHYHVKKPFMPLQQPRAVN